MARINPGDWKNTDRIRPGTRVLIVKDCRDGSPASGQFATFEGRFCLDTGRRYRAKRVAREGVIVALIRAGESLEAWEDAYEDQQRKPIFWNSRHNVERARVDRYVVQCHGGGHRAPNATLIEKQNPQARREDPHGE